MRSEAVRRLEGLLVVALEQAVAAPYCSSRLADAGARVIKIERPEGDFARGYDVAAGGLSSYFVWLNRGKESIVLDIKAPEDAALLQRMISRADVFIQNLAPGAAERAGFGAAALRARNRPLITVDLSGYGAGNSDTEMKAYDLLIRAESGLASITGHAAGPGHVGVSVCDIACGMTAHAAVLEALLARSRTDEGAQLEISLFDAIADRMTVSLLYFEGIGTAPQRIGLAHPSICPYGAFATGDSSLALIGIQNEREWASLCADVIGEPTLATATGFDSNNARVANRKNVDARIAQSIAAITRAEAARRLNAARIAYGFVNEIRDLVRHPALRRVGVATPAGVARLAAPPALRDGMAPVLGRVPAIGEHSTAIRTEFAA